MSSHCRVKILFYHPTFFDVCSSVSPIVNCNPIFIKSIKMRTILLLSISIVFIFSCKQKDKKTSLHQHTSKSITLTIDSLLTVYEKNGEFMGSLELSHKGKPIYSKAIGYSNIETKKKSDTNTKYRIGSISKVYTAVLIVKAIEENKLSFHETIDKYFPNIKNAQKITIANLLQHRSGIHSFTSDKKFFEYRTQYKSPEEMLSLISNYKSDFEPNSKGAYSNSNYFLLALILEKIYNTSYNSLLQEKICGPLELNNTYVRTKINIENNESYSYAYSDKWNEFTETDLSITKGSASIVSTPKEVNVFMEALFTNKILSKESIALMKTIKDRYGIGIFRYAINDRKGYGHRGHIDEFRSTSIYFLEEELAFTLISNGSKIDINDIYTEVLKLYVNDTPVAISETEAQKFAGTYVYEKDKTDKAVFVQDKNTLVHIIKDEYKKTLDYKGNNRFIFNQVYAESISFTFTPDGKEMILEQGNFKGKYIKE